MRHVPCISPCSTQASELSSWDWWGARSVSFLFYFLSLHFLFWKIPNPENNWKKCYHEDSFTFHADSPIVNLSPRVLAFSVSPSALCPPPNQLKVHCRHGDKNLSPHTPATPENTTIIQESWHRYKKSFSSMAHMQCFHSASVSQSFLYLIQNLIRDGASYVADMSLWPLLIKNSLLCLLLFYNLSWPWHFKEFRLVIL